MTEVIIEVNALIREIEKMKSPHYEVFNMTEGKENPDVLAQESSRLVGALSAYDTVIAFLREKQGCDDG